MHSRMAPPGDIAALFGDELTNILDFAPTLTQGREYGETGAKLTFAHGGEVGGGLPEKEFARINAVELLLHQAEMALRGQGVHGDLGGFMAAAGLHGDVPAAHSQLKKLSGRLDDIINDFSLDLELGAGADAPAMGSAVNEAMMDAVGGQALRFLRANDLDRLLEGIAGHSEYLAGPDELLVSMWKMRLDMVRKGMLEDFDADVTGQILDDYLLLPLDQMLPDAGRITPYITDRTKERTLRSLNRIPAIIAGVGAGESED